MTMDAPKQYKKPVDFDQLYPGRFLKAGELLGKKVTLTISDVDLEGLIGDDGKEKAKAIISFRESEKKLVACKTNGLCLKAMFGKHLSEWPGKRMTIFEDQWNGEPCIRVWGSPDIDEDIVVTVALPRRRPFNKTMHKTAGSSRTKAVEQPTQHVTTATAIEALRACKELETLNACWKTLLSDFQGDVPIDVEAVFNELKEALSELEEQEA